MYFSIFPTVSKHSISWHKEYIFFRFKVFSISPNIKFTFEYEHNNSFSFLDVKICHENNKLTTFVYRKPTFSEVFTNFKSFIPTVSKFGLVYTLLHRCFNITSSYEKFHNEINVLKQILQLNGYPT